MVIFFVGIKFGKFLIVGKIDFYVLIFRFFWFLEIFSKEEMNFGKFVCFFVFILILVKFKFYEW